ncbi:nuclear transport factor 2 family protein [Roseateles oligotrophus]|uniref:Nuclear transport factor 2 family protein n=1 Tax=Roseateles oligotrophus TaxID=1769250 RepID=A0ABT2YMU1_9BURK|nr:nuclear transport factor 2 family protein [Roseateles oligotrophus]MCV2371388.1 nuclear transport factor 2 family protein [Roseateles oligotrophus]
MPHKVETAIAEVEERLRLAMLASDTVALNELISPDLVFTNHVGQVLSKEVDLELHKSGTIRFQQLIPSETVVTTHGQFAVVSVRMSVAGTFAGTPFSENFRYTRVWRQLETKTWQVVAGHMSVVHEEAHSAG